MSFFIYHSHRHHRPILLLSSTFQLNLDIKVFVKNIDLTNTNLYIKALLLNQISNSNNKIIFAFKIPKKRKKNLINLVTLQVFVNRSLLFLIIQTYKHVRIYLFKLIRINQNQNSYFRTNSFKHACKHTDIHSILLKHKHTRVLLKYR